MAEVLSQDEVDALLNAVNDGNEDLKNGDDMNELLDEEDNIQPYDLTNQDRVIRGRMPILEIIYERFIRQFRVSLSNSLRKTATISIISTDLLKFGEFVNTLPIPTCMCIMRMNELKGPALLLFESKLAYSILDSNFGGVGRPFKKIEGKEFTHIELSFMRRVMDLAINDLEEAWAPVHRIDGQYLRTEINPQFVGVVPPSDVIIVTTFEVEFDNCAGSIMIAIPYSTIEPIKAKLSSSFQTDRCVEPRFKKETIKNLPVEVKGVVYTKPMTLGEVKNFKKGQVIPFSNFPVEGIKASVQVEGKEMLEGELTRNHTNNTIIIKEKK